MDIIHINYLALFVAAVVKSVFGSIWYSPQVCGATWSKLTGISPEQQRKGMAFSVIVELVANVIMADVLAYVLYYSGAASWDQAIGVAFWLWLGFIVTATVGAATFEKRSWRLLGIHWGYQLIGLGMMAVIIELWK